MFASSHPALPPGELTGAVKGKWGFDDWEGPKFHLLSAEAGKWIVAPSDQSALVVGREDTLHIVGADTLCAQKDRGAVAAKVQRSCPGSHRSRNAWNWECQ